MRSELEEKQQRLQAILRRHAPLAVAFSGGVDSTFLVAAARQAIGEAVAAITVHAPILDLNPCSINPDVAEVSIHYAVRSVSIAEQLGARILTLHPGRRTAKRPPGAADFTRFEHYLSALREVAMHNSLKICMENMEPAVNSFLCTPERVRQLLDDEPWLFFTLDTSHALAKSDEEPIRYIELCHDRLANVHFSRKEGKTLHLPLDRSPLMESVMHALKDAGYSGPLTLEIDDLNFPHHLSAEDEAVFPMPSAR